MSELTSPQPDSDHIELLKKRISDWLRQSRYRGRKSGMCVDVSFDDVIQLYQEYNWNCAYCGSPADSPDQPFPIKTKGPCVPANILPCCDRCRTKKHSADIIQFYKEKHITEQALYALVKKMLSRRGGDVVKALLKSIYVSDSEASQ